MAKKKRKAGAVVSSRQKKSKGTTREAGAGALPMDVVRMIMLKSTPTSLWNLQAVCKDWRQLIRSPEFIKERIGNAWMVGVGLKKQRLHAWAWVWLYDPVANQREKVKFPLIETWPKAWQWQWKGLSVEPAEQPGEVIVRADFARRAEYCRWNPITGFIELLAATVGITFFNRLYTSRWEHGEVPMQKEEGWMYTVSSDSKSRVLVAYTDCIKILKKDEDKSHWEVAGVMPDEMWQAMGQEKVKRFAAAQGYVLMWTGHYGGERAEAVVMFNLETGGWRMVDNKWHASSKDLCMWSSLGGPFFPTWVTG